MVLGVHSPDRVLSMAAALALAANIASCLVVDLIGDVNLAKSRTLADILEEGPRLDELSPGRPGVAVITRGSIDPSDAQQVIAGLSASWPALVVRVEPGGWAGPTVPVTPVYPGLLAPTRVETSVWQPLVPLANPPGPGPVMPSLRHGLVRRLLAGQIPSRSRWIAAWRAVWELPWA